MTVSDVIRRLNTADSPWVGDPSGEELLQPCHISDLLPSLRELSGCLWCLCGMREQLLSWLFGFSSCTSWTECLLYSGKQWGGLLINFRSACQWKHQPCPQFGLPDCVRVGISAVAWGSTRMNSMSLGLDGPPLKWCLLLLCSRDLLGLKPLFYWGDAA